MSSLVYDYKSIAAHMKGELAPKPHWPDINNECCMIIHTMHTLTDEQVRRVKQEWENAPLGVLRVLR
jgi:hypothetical protein